RYISQNNHSFSSYWKPTKDNLLPKLLPDVSLKESEQLIPLYFQVDELGDTVAKEYFNNKQFGEAIGNLHRDFSIYPSNKEQLSQDTQQLFEHLTDIRDCVDFDNINIVPTY